MAVSDHWHNPVKKSSQSVSTNCCLITGKVRVSSEYDYIWLLNNMLILKHAKGKRNVLPKLFNPCVVTLSASPLVLLPNNSEKVTLNTDLFSLRLLMSSHCKAASVSTVGTSHGWEGKKATTFGILELVSDTLMFPWVHSKFGLVSLWRENQKLDQEPNARPNWWFWTGHSASMNQTRESGQSKSMHLFARITSLCTFRAVFGEKQKNQTPAEVSETSVGFFVLWSTSF